MSAPTGDDGRPRSYDPYRRPPPPNHAQALVARSGFTVYEEGRTMFDQPVLVYEASRDFPNMAIFDHLGRPMGRTVRLDRGFLGLGMGTVRILDTWSNAVLDLRQHTGFTDASYSIRGVLDASLAPSFAGRRLTIRSRGVVHGELSAGGLMGVAGPRLTIYDATHHAVGELRGHHEYHHFLSSTYSYVMSIDPGLRGPLRQALIAVPIALGMLRRRRQNN